jgi:hypothetical protein
MAPGVKEYIIGIAAGVGDSGHRAASGIEQRQPGRTPECDGDRRSGGIDGQRKIRMQISQRPEGRLAS